MPADSVGFAIVGAGMIADYHQQAIAANAEHGAHLVAVSHHDPAQFAAISARFGVPCLALDALLARDDVDAVCVCTPSGQHAAQTIAAAQAGKHVLVEKPMALSLADADAMIAACAAADMRLGVVLQRREEPVFKQVKRALETGALGDLTLGAVTIPYVRPQSYYDQAAWRGTWALDGGGVLMNQGIHLVDLLVWFFGDPVEVQANAATLARNIEVEDTLVATLRFANGALATITATTTAAPGFPHTLSIYGTNGGIQIVGEQIARWAQVGVTQELQSTNAASVPAGAGGDPRGIALSGHIAIIREFIASIRAGRTPQVDGREGRRSLAAVLATYAAAGLTATNNR